MSLIDTIRADQLTARKAGAEQRAAVNLLTTLLSEAERIGKDDGNRQTTDEETISVIRKFVKNLDEVMRLRPEDFQALHERAILDRYLPAALSDEDVREFIALEYPNATIKNMKPILATLNERHPGAVTGAQVAAILRG